MQIHSDSSRIGSQLRVSQNSGYHFRGPLIRAIVFWGLYWGPPLFWETTLSYVSYVDKVAGNTKTSRPEAQAHELRTSLAIIARHEHRHRVGFENGSILSMSDPSSYRGFRLQNTELDRHLRPRESISTEDADGRVDAELRESGHDTFRH